MVVSLRKIGNYCNNESKWIWKNILRHQKKIDAQNLITFADDKKIIRLFENYQCGEQIK